MNQLTKALVGMLHAPVGILVTGGMGSGKSHLVSYLNYVALTYGENTYVLSNIKVVRWDAEKGRPFEEYPERYYLCRSFAQILRRIAMTWTRHRREGLPEPHFVISIDEAGLSFHRMSYARYASIVLPMFISQLRKIRSCLVLIVQDPEILLKVIRESKVFTSIRFAKEPDLLVQYAPDWLQFYPPRELALYDAPGMGTRWEPQHITCAPWLALPSDQAIEKGVVYFDSESPAGFTLGKHPVTGKDLDFEALINALDEGVGYDIPHNLEKFLETGDIDPIVAAREELAETERLERKRPVTQHGKSEKGRIVEMIIAGEKNKDIVRLTGRSLRRVRQVRKELKEAGAT